MILQRVLPCRVGPARRDGGLVNGSGGITLFSHDAIGALAMSWLFSVVSTAVVSTAVVGERVRSEEAWESPTEPGETERGGNQSFFVHYVGRECLKTWQLLLLDDDASASFPMKSNQVIGSPHTSNDPGPVTVTQVC